MRKYVLLMACLALLAACQNEDQGLYQGYVEGDYIDVAAQVGGRLEKLAVDAGDAVAIGDELFRLEENPEQLQQQQAGAQLAIIQAQQQEAAFALKQARDTQMRLHALKAGSFISAEQLDQAETAVAQAQARLAALEASKQATQAALAQADWALQQKQQRSTVNGVVEDVFYESGELMAAGRPVLRLLPAGALKLRFFVPETEIGSWHVGDRVSVHCDGCESEVAARVSHIATSVEYTPPVIFSRETREKLVVMLEAEPESEAGLHVGQPVDVTRSLP